MTSAIRIPQANPRAAYLAHRDDIDAAVLRTLDSGRYILGPETEAFESEFSRWAGTGYAVGTGSGTDALHLGLRAAGIGSGDEVITVSHTAVATVAAIELAGATPRFVDIDPQTFTMDPVRLQERLSARTKAVIPVHIYGHPADMDAILEIARSRGLVVLEDCAQAAGAMYKGQRVGTLGDMGAFSFYPTKNLGAIGDAGALLTGNPVLAEKARALRQYGWRTRYLSDLPGMNTRLDEVQAAILRVKLRHLNAENGRRDAIASRYQDTLEGNREIVSPPNTARSDAQGQHAWHLYVIRSRRRDELQAFLADRAIGTLIHYPMPVHLQPGYSRLRAGSLAETERAAREILSLPLWPEMSDAEVTAVCSALREFDGRDS